MAAMGVALHAVLAITSIVEFGLSRYAIPVWPIVCTLDAIAILIMLRSRDADGLLTPIPAVLRDAPG
jgi:hypothetical protein